MQGSTFDAFVDQLKTVKSTLPVIEDEIGDTWIYGGASSSLCSLQAQTHGSLVAERCIVASDPLKLAQFREILRLRRRCLVERKCAPADAALREFDRILTKVGEHTWGLDVKVHVRY